MAVWWKFACWKHSIFSTLLILRARIQFSPICKLSLSFKFFGWLRFYFLCLKGRGLVFFFHRYKSLNTIFQIESSFHSTFNHDLLSIFVYKFIILSDYQLNILYHLKTDVFEQVSNCKWNLLLNLFSAIIFSNGWYNSFL